MPKRYGAFDDAAPPDPVEASALEQSTRRVRRRLGSSGDGGTRTVMNTLRLGGFVDRLFENTTPRTDTHEATRLRRAALAPSHRAALAGAGPAYGGGRRGTIGRGVLSWADARLGTVARRTPTPRIIIRFFGLIVLLTVLAFGTSSFTISQMRDTVRSIALHTKPAIDAAEQVRTALGAMDVDAASDSLLGDAVSTGTSREFAAHVGSQIAAMVQASSGITFGDAEAAARIEAMQYDLHLYYGALGEARDAGRSKPWIAAQRVKFASRILRSYVMRQADAFEAGNRRKLEESYIRSQEQSVLLAASFLGLGTLLTITLIGAQVFLLRRTRRLVNVPLAIGTMALVAALVWVGLSLVQERADLATGKTDALERLVALRQVKSAAYSMNADEAMWLIDHEANRVDYDKDFVAGTRLVADIDPADVAGLMQLQAQYTTAAPAPSLHGLLGSAYARALDAASGAKPTADAIVALLEFLRIDAQLRTLEDKGDHRGALELRTGNKPGQSLYAFAQLDKALDVAIGVADSAFTQRISAAGAVADWLPTVTGMALAAALLLAAGGLWQRWQEYR
jgi:hypothetical protein